MLWTCSGGKLLEAAHDLLAQDCWTEQVFRFFQVLLNPETFALYVPFEVGTVVKLDGVNMSGLGNVTIWVWELPRECWNILLSVGGLVGCGGVAVLLLCFMSTMN